MVLIGQVARSAPSFRRPSAAAIFGWAGAIAVLMSTQFLFQPFVWENWTLTDIVGSWVHIAGSRVIVAIGIASALVAAGPPRARTSLGGGALLLAALIAGAIAGELMLSVSGLPADRLDPLSFMGRVLRWSIVGVAVAAIAVVWRTGDEQLVEAEEARADATRRNAVIVAAELESLRRQIEPHFLFNTLATIGRLQKAGAAAGHDLLTRLFDYMAASFAGAGLQQSTLGYEVDLARAYLDVCAARMDGRLTVLDEVPPELRSFAFPPLIIATLAENAVKHGLATRVSGGTILVSARLDNGFLQLSVADDGVGLSGSGGSGIGLANALERLRLLYGAQAALRLEDNLPRGVRAIVRVPHAA